MAKQISKDRLNRLKNAGVKVVGEAREESAQDQIPVKELRAIISQAEVKTDEQIKRVDTVMIHMQQQIEQLAAIVRINSQKQDNLPLITGFKLNRGSDGYTNTVSLIREKTRLN